MTRSGAPVLVTIAINNYNYARFVGDAIDSALAQSWRPLEVVVVDDGSTDHSWSVIQRYGTRIHAIRQGNTGQGGAYNAGFAASRGEWVLFLDADDLLDADAIERMMRLAVPGVAKVQGQLRRVAVDGSPLGGVVPYLVHDGDVTPIARRFRQYASPPASGNLFRRSAIEAYLPMPPRRWRTSADTVPILLSAFHGRVATTDEPIGRYRLHSAANAQTGLFGNIGRTLASTLLQAESRRDAAETWGTRCSGIAWPIERPGLPWDWRTRALSWRLKPDDHPYPGDTRRVIWRGLNRSLAQWPGYSALERLALRAWIGGLLLVPRAWSGAFVAVNLSGGLRARFRRLQAQVAARDVAPQPLPTERVP